MDPAVLSSWKGLLGYSELDWKHNEKCNEYRCSYVDGICGFSNIGLFYFHWPTTHDKIQQWLSWIIAETKARPKSCRATEGQLVHDAPWWVFGSKNHLNLPVVENCLFMWKCHGWLQAIIIKYEFRSIHILSIESSWNISKELPEIFLQHFTTFQYLYCTIFPKQLHTVRKKLPKKQGQGDTKGTWTPRIDGASPKLTSSACSKSSRSWENPQLSTVRGMWRWLFPLKKTIWAKLGLENVVLFLLVCFCLNVRISILLAIIFHQWRLW